MEQLGIQPSLLLAQIINFSIIVIVLSKLLYTPILTMLEKRRKEIEKALILTQKMEEEEAKLAVKKQRLVDDARKEAQGIIEEARNQAKSAEREIIEQAHSDARSVIQRAKSDVDTLRQEMEKDVRRQSVELAGLMAKRLITQVLSSEDKHKIIEKHLRELTARKNESA